MFRVANSRLGAVVRYRSKCSNKEANMPDTGKDELYQARTVTSNTAHDEIQALLQALGRTR